MYIYVCYETWNDMVCQFTTMIPIPVLSVYCKLKVHFKMNLWNCKDQLWNKTIHKCDVQFYIQYQYAHGACKWNAIPLFFSIKCVSIRKRISRFRVDNSLENI